MGNTITLTKDYGQEAYKASGLADGTVIDATAASWIIDNSILDGDGANAYPFRVYNSPNVTIEGGVMHGEVSLTEDWETLYYPKEGNGNSVAIRVESSPNAIIQDWKIDRAFDGIRIAEGTTDFLIQNMWVTDVRDDVIENDPAMGGTIRNSLFDGVFAGISTDGDVDGSMNTIKLDGVLMRMESYLYSRAGEGAVTHASPFKTDSGNPDFTPSFEIRNTVIAIENPEHESFGRLQIAWDNVTASENNVYLNLSDKPLPSNYPMPPKGFTILQGQAARDYWEDAKAEWIASHGDEASLPSLPEAEQPLPPEETPVPPPPSEEELPPPPSVEQPTFKGEKHTGKSAAETIIGNSLNNVIDGGDGNDVIKGAAGNDVIRGNEGTDSLWGGSGNDTFLFKRLSDSNDDYGFDTIMDFEQGHDVIDLSMIDASRQSSGDQAFSLAAGPTTTPGKIWFKYDQASNLTTVSANVDKDTDVEMMFHIKGQVALTASDFLL
ncbi:M10 family metallopeptidase C-terminal domain-containing protein [Microvirga massiliensis]|uniref:M10 family metallopeptidase C-terminal domain-containing protein n=1 Tax=Microvirga massiliensis TaxID=1033741 RepID=UPI00062B9D1B|nr:M10 family metallopeptidase C-terminal domain-containing protein [Microvirga massiliensis]